GDPARTDAAFVDRAQALDDGRADRQSISEWRLCWSSGRSEWPRRRRPLRCEQRRKDAGGLVARSLAAEPLDLLARRDRNVAGAERRTARRERAVDRSLLERRELLALRGKRLAAAHQPGARGQRRCLQPLRLAELAGQGPGPRADYGQRRIEQHADLDEVVGPPAVREREQRRASRHDREAGEQRRHRLLLFRQPLA